LDETAKIKIEHEISRIDKLLGDVKPLLNLCKIKDPDIIEMTAAAQVLHSFYNGIESVLVLFFKYKNEKLPNKCRFIPVNPRNDCPAAALQGFLTLKNSSKMRFLRKKKQKTILLLLLLFSPRIFCKEIPHSDL